MTGILRSGPGSGVVYQDLSIDREGQREYTLRYLIPSNVEQQVSKTSKKSLLETGPVDGPLSIANTHGLPRIGSPWHIGNDYDFWARRTPQVKVKPYQQKNDPVLYWLVEFKFSTAPRYRETCSTNEVGDPLLEPMKISGSFQSEQVEVRKDKDGNLIESSSHEVIKGPQVAFDVTRPTVVIQQNKPSLELPLLSQLINTVNAKDIWGLTPRHVKLSSISWEMLVNGDCYFYYSRTFEFHIRMDTLGFDRNDIMDEGTKVLKGKWTNTATSPTWVVDSGVDKDNQQDFMRAKDVAGEMMNVMLDGNGKPLASGATPAMIPLIDSEGAVKYYPDQVDLGAGDVDVDYVAMLGVPLTL